MSKNVLWFVVTFIAVVAMSDVLLAQTRVANNLVPKQATAVAPGAQATKTPVAKTQATKTQAAKTQVTKTQAAKTQVTKTQAAKTPATAVKPATSVVSPNSTPSAQQTSGVNHAYRQRVGLGFNGIPFDGSHREATRMRRANRYR